MTNLIDIKYSKQELATYANSSDTCVTLVRKTRDVLLHPVQLSDLSAGVRQNLDALLLKYDYMFNSIILGYNRIKILSKCGLICRANARIKVQVEADFYLFNPAVGSKLKGVVCKRSGHHLGCLVHKAFNAYIPTKDESHMSGLYYFIGQDLTFTVVDLDLTSGRLPYLRGQLDDGNTERNDGDGIVNQVGPDSGTSFSHEEDAGGWDSGIALSSPGKNTIVNEELESADKCNYGMKRESRLTSKAIQLAARNTKNKLTNKMKNSPKTERSVDRLSNIAKVLDKYYSSQDYGISDDESQQLVQETVRGSESFSTDNSSPAKEKSKLKSNKTLLKTKKCLKETPCNPENSIIEEPETSSNHVKSDGKTGNTAKEIIGMVDMDSKATSTTPRKKRKSISKNNCSSPGNDDMIKQLLKSMERSFTEEETDVSEKKVLENTAILSSPVKVVEEREEIGNDSEPKPRIQESKGDNEVSFKSPSSTTKRRKSTSRVKKISIPENIYLESGGSLTDLNESIKDEDSKLRPESQNILGESGSSSVDSVLAVKKKRKSKNITDKSPLKSEKCVIESLGGAKQFIQEGPKTSPLVQSDEKTVQRSIDMATNVTPSSVKKKGKSTSKKNVSSPSSDDLIKQLLKSMERSFAEEETDVSEKEDLKNIAIIPPPVKVVVDSEGMGNEDKSKIRTQEGSEDGGISIKNPSSSCKKRKSISKVKKVGTPEKEDAIKKLVKDIEMSTVETEITKDKSLETNDKEETTLGAIAKVTGRKEKVRKSTGSLKEKDKLLVIRKELVTASDSEKMPDKPVENYAEQIEKHILSKNEAIREIKSTLDAVQLSVKKKKRKSSSNGSTVSSNTTGEEKAVTQSSEVIEESEVEKLIAKNKKLLGNEHGSEGDSGLKDEIPSLKDRKAMKRKRESKDLTESPQRKKVAKSHSDTLDTPKVSDVLRPGNNSIDSS